MKTFGLRPYARFLLLSVPITVLAACTAVTDAPHEATSMPEAESTATTASAATAPAALTAQERLFPEIFRGGALDHGNYNAEACMPVTTDAINESLMVPMASTERLFAKMGLASPCNNTGAACDIKIHSNTLYVGKSVTISNNKVSTDDPKEADAVGATQLNKTAGGEIIVADKITLKGDILLDDNRLYVFVARQQIDLGADLNIHDPQDAAAEADGELTVSRSNASARFIDTRITHPADKRGKDGAVGRPGANIVLIAPKVTGASPARIDVRGQDGQPGEHMPNMACLMNDVATPPQCDSFAGDAQDQQCWDKEGEDLSGGKGGAGGPGGHVLVISDDASGFTPDVLDGGGDGGSGGHAGEKVWTLDQGPKNGETGSQIDPNKCTGPTYKHYGTAGANGAAGKQGTYQKVALNGKIRDYLFWLGGRAGRRDMLNAHYYSLSTDPDTTGGPANRATATQLYQNVTTQFCEATPPVVSPTSPLPHPYLPDGEQAMRVTMCHEAYARLSPLQNGQNYFGVPYDMTVYADPAQLKEQRDRYLNAYTSTYMTDFKDAKKAGEDPINAFYDYVVTDAQQTSVQRSLEVATATAERDRYFQASKFASQQLTENLNVINDENAKIARYFDVVHESMEYYPGTDWTQFTHLVKVMAEFGAEVVEAIADGYEGQYEKETEVAVEFFKTIEEEQGYFGKIPGETYNVDDETKLKDLVTGQGPAKMGQAICDVEQVLPDKVLLTLDQLEADVGGDQKSPATAHAALDVMRRLTTDVHERARQSCSLWQTMTLTGRDALLAQDRLNLALLKQKQANTLSWLAGSFSPSKVVARYDARRDAACQESRIWEEQIMLFDFLTARAEYYGHFREPDTKAAKGDFHWQLLNDGDNKQYLAESVTGALSFDGWTPPTTWTSDYLASDTTCAPGGNETEARCGAERGVINQLLDTGLVRTRPEDGPARFPLQTEGNNGRVTHVAASILGPSSPVLAARASHDAAMTYVKTGVAPRTVLSSPAGGRDLCELLEARNNALRSRVSSLPQSLHCDTVPMHFVVGADVATPDLFIWQKRNQSFTEAADQWNDFGASPRGLWTLDFRPTYRELNRQDGCYATLVAANTTLHSSDIAVRVSANAGVDACIGEAFLPSDCKEAQAKISGGNATPADIAAASACLSAARKARVASFVSTCQPHLTSAAGGYALTSDPTAVIDATPEDCDRVCGSQCKALKASVTGMRLDLQTRSSN